MFDSLQLRWWRWRLRSPDPRVRAAACWRVGKLNAPGAVELLLDRLGDPAPSVQQEAESGLSSLARRGQGSRPATEKLAPLLVALREGDWRNREQACRKLSELDDPRSLAGLAAAIHDTSAHVRAAATEAFRQVAGRDAETRRACLLSPRAAMRQAACQMLTPMQAAGLCPLLARLVRDRDPRVRTAAVRALGRAKSQDACRPLVRALADGDRRVRKEAALALGELRDPRSVRSLTRLVGDPDRRVRAAACQALSGFGETAWSPLQQLLSDGEPGVRRSACMALAAGEAPGRVGSLCACLRDRDWTVRRAACRALQQVADAAAFEPLVQALDDSSARVRQAAIRALAALGPQAVKPLRSRLKDVKPAVVVTACQALAELNAREATPQLMLTLGHRDATVREAAGEALDALGEGEIARVVLQAAAGEGKARQEISRLAAAGDLRALEPLLQRLQDDDPVVRRSICLALGAMDDARAAEAVRECLSADDWRVREGACQAVATMQDKAAREALQDRLHDRRAEVRAAACKALAAVGDAGDIESLLERLGDASMRVREAAGLALATLGESRLPAAVLGSLHGESDAVEALGALDDEEAARAMELLLPHLTDQEWPIRQASCTALAALGRAETIDPLIERLGDEQQPVRQAAAAALRALGAGHIVDEVDGALGLSRLASGVLGALRRQPEARQALVDLAMRGERRIAMPLIARLDDSDPVVAEGSREALIALGPYAVDDLLRVAVRHHPPPPAGIGEVLTEIRKRLEPQLPEVLCRQDFTRFTRHARTLPGAHVAVIATCRACGKASGALIGIREVVARLDCEMEPPYVVDGGVLHINWLRFGQPCDIDRVEIVSAADRHVEELCLALGNDIDDHRSRRYRSMRCLVASGITLSPAARNMLHSTFGKVVTEPITVLEQTAGGE